jgi:hypothetical protein
MKEIGIEAEDQRQRQASRLREIAHAEADDVILGGP